jgi:hypothetical protein
LVAAFIILLGQACAGAKLDSSPTLGGDGGSGGNGGPSGAGGGISINPDAIGLSPPHYGREASVGDAKPYRCDDAGNCDICLTILSLGQPAHYGEQSGGGDNTDAFQNFMNTNTNAKMVMLKTYTPLTDSLLNQYDVVILQALEDSEYTGLWSYSQSDVAALTKWVNNGGAIISMSGYGSNVSEVQPLNQLLSPFGITYNPDNIFDASACTDNLCYCSYGSIPFTNWQAGDADSSAITTNHDGNTLGKVGIFLGRSINCSGDCSVFATDPKPVSGEGSVGVAKVIGNGRVFAWADEWVTYTSQWGLTPDPTYDNAKTYAQCVGHTPYTSYAVPQFWYNAFKWAVPSAACFTIDQPANPVQQIIY